MDKKKRSPSLPLLSFNFTVTIRFCPYAPTCAYKNGLRTFATLFYKPLYFGMAQWSLSIGKRYDFCYPSSSSISASLSHIALIIGRSRVWSQFAKWFKFRMTIQPALLVGLPHCCVDFRVVSPLPYVPLKEPLSNHLNFGLAW